MCSDLGGKGVKDHYSTMNGKVSVIYCNFLVMNLSVLVAGVCFFEDYQIVCTVMMYF